MKEEDDFDPDGDGKTSSIALVGECKGAVALLYNVLENVLCLCTRLKIC